MNTGTVIAPERVPDRRRPGAAELDRRADGRLKTHNKPALSPRRTIIALNGTVFPRCSSGAVCAGWSLTRRDQLLQCHPVDQLHDATAHVNQCLVVKTREQAADRFELEPE